MKKLVKIALLLTLATTAWAENNQTSTTKELSLAARKSGFILGGGGVLALDEMNVENTDDAVLISYALEGGGWGARLGYQHYLWSFLGARIYVDYHRTRTAAQKSITEAEPGEASTTVQLDHAALNQLSTGSIDLLIDLLNFTNFSAGLIAGGYLGQVDFKDEIKIRLAGKTRTDTLKWRGKSYGLNLGLGVSLAGHHHLELLARLPLNEHSQLNPTTGNTVKMKFYSFTLGYYFSF